MLYEVITSLSTDANTVSSPDTYTVTVTSSNGCTDTESITITQDVVAPVATITNNTGTAVLDCSTTSISLTASGGASYVWSGGSSTTRITSYNVCYTKLLRVREIEVVEQSRTVVPVLFIIAATGATAS